MGGGVGERHHNKDIKELYNQTELNRTTVHKLPWARKANCLINFDILRQIFLSDAAAAAGLRLVPSTCYCNISAATKKRGKEMNKKKKNMNYYTQQRQWKRNMLSEILVN